jgi:hypothetical protein
MTHQTLKFLMFRLFQKNLQSQMYQSFLMFQMYQMNRQTPKFQKTQSFRWCQKIHRHRLRRLSLLTS